jgi:hypothetical protein
LAGSDDDGERNTADPAPVSAVTMQTDSEERFARFVERVSRVLGVDPEIHEVVPRVPADGKVLSLIYADRPEPGFVAGITYGLSLLTSGRELCITMHSSDPGWAMVPASTVAALRGLCTFKPGMVIGYAKPYVAGSGLSSLLLGAPDNKLALGGKVDLTLSSGQDAEDFVELAGAYPIYASEREAFQTQGAEMAWSSGWDPSDPNRPALV